MLFLIHTSVTIKKSAKVDKNIEISNQLIDYQIITTKLKFVNFSLKGFSNNKRVYFFIKINGSSYKSIH
ncbi:hypothetical protein CRH01_17490 [Chryseobacterium rhizosphaerae]|nr:hypothetical protein CRH01_17490 [Chryseobacterium rhizosphaerae]